uniref:Uncharacterized protein n=1 Tax=Rhizophora mucronata TaxID=61149 RepID=A0A2P2QD06_RHIMU
MYADIQSPRTVVIALIGSKRLLSLKLLACGFFFFEQCHELRDVEVSGLHVFWNVRSKLGPEF